MPQKKNPDPLELMRGKSGRVLGRLSGWLTTMKGLPSGYNRDLQEDKEAAFEVEATLAASLDVAAAVMAGLRLNAARAEAAASGLLLATDVAEHLVAAGVPFRQAHAVVGAIVRQLAAEGRDFSQLTEDEWAAFDPHFTPAIAASITAATSVAAKRTPQSTSPSAVGAALAELRAWLE
jgi:argininosuccinate lyase